MQLTDDLLKALKTQHLGFLEKQDVSKGQFKDSKTILDLITYIDWYRDRLEEWKQTADHTMQQRDKLRAENEKLREDKRMLVEALQDILSTVSLEWYCQQFGKNTPRGIETGIAARIHNQELITRIHAAFKKAKNTLKELGE